MRSCEFAGRVKSTVSERLLPARPCFRYAGHAFKDGQLLSRDAPQGNAQTTMTDRSLFPPVWRTQFRRRLLAWYRKHARSLPWRETRDPYAIWVSEAMLQQTQVATVQRYYARFLAAFPTLHHLAAATESDVLRLWEGLGYYRRARNLQRGVQAVVREHDGRFPRDLGAAQRLPGVGRYTAGAILSFAFDERAPIVEANTLRLYARLLAFDEDPRSAAGQRVLWQAAAELLPARGAGEFNQALMELGSQVCSPKAPKCSECPVVKLCPTFARGWQARIPPPAKSPAVTELHEAAVAVRRGPRVLLVQRQSHERWAGLWDFPRVQEAGTSPMPEEEVAAQLTARWRLKTRAVQKVGSIRHTVTRYRIELACYTAECQRELRRQGVSTSIASPRRRWCTPTQMADLPLSVPARRLAEVIAY